MESNDATLIRRNRWAWGRLRTKVLVRDGGRCTVCGREATEVDHIVPRSQGGTDDPSNLRSLCRRDHLRASADQAAADYMVRPQPHAYGYDFPWHIHRQEGNLQQVIGSTDTPTPLPDCKAAGCTLP